MKEKKKILDDEQDNIYSSFTTNTVEENDEEEVKNFDNNYMVTKAKRTSKLLLFGFYALILAIIGIIYFMFRSDRYEFYLVKDEVTLSNGSTYQVELTPKNASYFDYLNYNYTVADESIAKVDEYGTITAVGSGSTTLKISIKNGLSSKEMVINTEGADIQKIDLYVYKDKELQKDSSASMTVDESLTLKAVANDNKNLFVDVEYDSSDDNVAEVDAFGNVTAKGEGTAVITGTRNDVSGEITINVSANNETNNSSSNNNSNNNSSSNHNSSSNNSKQTGPATRISLGSTSMTKYVGETITFKIKTTPSNAKLSKVSWSSNNPSAATVDKNGVVKTVGAGTAVIKASADGLITTCTILVKAKPTNTNTNTNNATAPAGTQVKASEVNLTKTSLTVSKGKTATFEIKVSGALGLISVSSSDSSIATVKTTSTDCNNMKCFFDAQTGQTSTISFTVTGVKAGKAYIKVNLDDLISYNDKIITGSGKVGILVK